MVPPLWIECVGSVAPKLWEPMNGVGQNVDGGPCWKVIPTEPVRAHETSTCSRDRRDVSQRLTADIIKIGQLIEVNIHGLCFIQRSDGIE